jgi:hypothetical protein
MKMGVFMVAPAKSNRRATRCAHIFKQIAVEVLVSPQPASIGCRVSSYESMPVRPYLRSLS